MHYHHWVKNKLYGTPFFTKRMRGRFGSETERLFGLTNFTEEEGFVLCRRESHD